MLESKSTYRFRAKDFIPLVGVNNYSNRNPEGEINPCGRRGLREGLLVFYNVTILTSLTFLIIKGLEKSVY